MSPPFSIPQYVTHYYVERPFLTLTDLMLAERTRVIERLQFPKAASDRLHSAFYFEQRLRYEQRMHEQFVAKGGEPMRRHPHYAVLGESEIWAEITTHAVRIPLSTISPTQVSFTYTDSWVTYVDRDLVGNPIPRKPQYDMLYRWDELEPLFRQHGWPGDRWKTGPEWEHDLYVEVQIWTDDLLGMALPDR